MTAAFIVKPPNLGLFFCLNWSVHTALERLPTAHQLESPAPGFSFGITAVILTEAAKGFSLFLWVPKTIPVIPGGVLFLIDCPNALSVWVVSQIFFGVYGFL